MVWQFAFSDGPDRNHGARDPIDGTPRWPWLAALPLSSLLGGAWSSYIRAASKSVASISCVSVARVTPRCIPSTRWPCSPAAARSRAASREAAVRVR